MARIEDRERTADTGIDRIQDAFKAGRFVERLAEGVSSGELQAMRKALIERRLQRVVGRVGDRVLGEDAAEYRNSVSGAAGASQRIALRRRIAAKPDKSQAVRSSVVPAGITEMILGIRQVEIHWKRLVSCGNDEEYCRQNTGRSVPSPSTAFRSRQVCGISIVQVVGREQTMSLRSHVAHLQFQIPGQFALDRQVVLRGILTSHVRLKLTE